MSEDTTVVKHDLVVVDHGSKVLSGLSGMANKLSHSFNHMTTELMSLTGLGALGVGAFGMVKAVEEANEYIGRVKKISEITGMAAGTTDGLMEGMRKVGIEGAEAESILTRMSKKGAQLEASMYGAHHAGGSMNKQLAHLGLDMKHGPEAAFLSMAKVAEKGNLDASQLAIAFRIPQDSALKMLKLAKEGPAKMKEGIEELRSSGMALNETDMANMGRLKKARNEIGAGWERIVLVIGKQMLPVLADLMESVAKKMPEWTEHAKEFGKWLNEHLASGLATVKSIGKVLLANALIQKATAAAGLGKEGAGLGLISGAKAGGSAVGKMFFGGGFLRKEAPVNPQAMMAALFAQAHFPGLAAGNMKGPTFGDRFAEQKGMGLGNFDAFFSAATKLGPLVSGLLKLAGTAGLIVVAAGVVEAVLMNTEGVADFLEDTFTVIAEKMGGIGDMMKEGGAKSALADLGADVAHGLGIVAKHFAIFFQTLGNLLGDLFENPMEYAKKFATGSLSMQDEFSKMYAKNLAMDDARMAQLALTMENKKYLEPPPEKNSKTEMNFPNARFDIKQSFAEGFDPDRVAVAFTDKIQSLGERRLQSSFSPLFSVK